MREPCGISRKRPVAAFVAHAGLARHEGLETFFAKLRQHGGGRDIGVPLGTAFVRRVREDGRRDPADLIVGQRVIAAQRRGTGSESGCELHGISPDEKGLLFKPHTGFLDSEPSL